MENLPLISVIIPVGIYTNALKETLKSVLDQTYKNFELIITGNPDPGTALLIKRFADERIRVIVDSNHYTGSLNSGFTAARGKFIVPIDESTIMFQDRLQIQYEYMKSHPSIDVCACNIQTDPYNTKKYAMDNIAIMASMLFGNPIAPRSVMIRKVSLLRHYQLRGNKLMIYNDKYYYSGDCGLEDYKLWTELMKKGFNFIVLPDVLSAAAPLQNLKKESLPDQTKNSFLTMQASYMKFMANKLVRADEEYFDLLESSIILHNNGKIELDDLKKIVGSALSCHRKALKKQTSCRKILFCISSLEEGGAEKLLVELLENFNYEKYSVDLLVLNGYGAYFKNIPDQVNWFTLQSAKYHLLDTYDVEIAFLEGEATKYIAMRDNMSRKVSWIHCDLLNHHWTKSFYRDEDEEKACYLRMDKIIFVSKNAQKQFLKLFPDVSTQQEVIYNLVDKKNILINSKAFTVKKKALTLCSIGRLVAEKGYDRLIPVVARLAGEGLTFDFLIIGDGYQREHIQGLIDQFSLHNIVSLIGYKSNPYPYLQTSDVFVSVSFSEGFSLAIGEALCLSKPVCATKTAGSAEILDNGQYGLIVEQDHNSIYEGLKRIITDENLRVELAKKALFRSMIFEKDLVLQQIDNLCSPEKAL